MGSTKKPKRRNTEKRKEKSRDAARTRRGKEQEVFSDLLTVLPLSAAAREQVDKASIMRLSISHLKLQNLIQAEKCRNGKLEKDDMSHLYPKALDGFLMIVDNAGDMIFMSDNVSKCLGIAQIDLIGQSIYEFSHPCDHDEIREIISEKMTSDITDHTFFIRMKSTLTSKGRNINLKSATFKVIKCSGHMMTVQLDASQGNPSKPRYMAVICEHIPHPSNIEVPMDAQTFLTRHNLDMTFTYCDDRIQDLLGYSDEELIGESFFNYQHALDTEKVAHSFKDLFHKGQSVTGMYRFLARDGGYAWLETQSTIIYNSRTEKPQCVVCINFVVSGIEEQHMVLSDVQQDVQDRPRAPIEVRPIKPANKHANKYAGHVSRKMETLMSPPAPPAPRKTESFLSSTPSVVSPIAKKAAEKPQKKGFCGVTESMFVPRTVEMERNGFGPPDTELYVDLGANIDKLAYLAPSMGEVKNVEVGKGANEKVKNVAMEKAATVDVSFYDNMMYDLNQESSPQKELPFLSGARAPKGSVQALDTDSSSEEEFSPLSPPAKDPPSLAMTDSPIAFTSSMFGLDDLGQEFDLNRRAPYIPMNEDDDMIFSSVPVMLVDQSEDEAREMLGATESIFTPKPDKNKSDNNYQIPMSILKQQAGLKRYMPEGNVARNAGPPKTKRPMETNRLETGPPKKMPRSGSPEARKSMTFMLVDPGEKELKNKGAPPDGCSVLKNLLLCGKDDNFGYTIPEGTTNEEYPICISPEVMSPDSSIPSPMERPIDLTASLINPSSPSSDDMSKFLTCLSQQDYEVNAPVRNASRLLEGLDILNALDGTGY